MKFLLIISLFLVIPKLSQAQNTESLTYEFSGTPYSFKEIVNVDSTLKKDQLFSKAIEWFALTFKNSNAVLKMQDKENGVIIGKGSFLWSYEYPPKYVSNLPKPMPIYQSWVSFTIKINVKDGRFKYELLDFYTDGYGIVKDGTITKYPEIKMKLSTGKKYQEMALLQFNSLQNQVKESSTSIINGLKISMTKSSNEVW